jgi:hypothetical protein
VRRMSKHRMPSRITWLFNLFDYSANHITPF